MRKTLLVFLALLFSLVLFGFEGTVFIDENQNEVKETDEIVLEGVLVSDGKTIVETNNQGIYSLDTEEPFIFIIMPNGYRSEKWYLSTKSNRYDFPLIETNNDNDFFAVASDIHYAKNEEDFSEALNDRWMEYDPNIYIKKLKQKLENIKPSFVIALGDIGASIRDIENEKGVEQLETVKNYLDIEGADIYYAVGNHEVDKTDPNPTGVYQKVFGPRYYSFNRNEVHFIVLDLHEIINNDFTYTIDEKQLKWLEAELKYVDKRTPIVVFSHEPICDIENTPNNKKLMELLTTLKINAHISGHLHHMAVLQEEPFPVITCGAVCGAWWEGPSPTGEEFGYTLFTLDRGVPNYGYFLLDKEPSIWFDLPLEGMLSGIINLRVTTLKEYLSPSLFLDGIKLDNKPTILRRGCWYEYLYRLNVSGLKDGEHLIAFGNEDMEQSKRIWVSNQNVTIKQLKNYPEAFEGRNVNILNAKPKVVWGSNISFDDGTDLFMTKLSNLELTFEINRSRYYHLNGIYRNSFRVADPLRIYLDEGVVQKIDKEE
ncbi:MAG: metallophosphoesterase [Kosmotogaceae bacterium]